MEDTISVKSASPAGTTASNGTKRRRANEPKFYAVRTGHTPGVYSTWQDCLDQVKGFKKAIFKSFATLVDAERFVAGQDSSSNNGPGSSPASKFYAVRSGRVPGIYTDWPSAQEQITGWQKPKHRCFATRVEAQKFLDEDIPTSAESAEVDAGTLFNSYAPIESSDPAIQPPPPKKAKKAVASTKGVKSESPIFREEDYEAGTGPFPPGAEDGFDPNIILDAKTGKVIYKTQEQRQAMKPAPAGCTETGPIRIHTDGSSLGNGQSGAFAGVGVYFGPCDQRNVSETLSGPRQTNQRAELTAILRALEIVPRNRDVVIITDSRNGWKNSAGKAVENKDIIENVLSKIEERKNLRAQTEFEWIKGHANHPGNVAADKLAVDAARNGPPPSN